MHEHLRDEDGRPAPRPALLQRLIVVTAATAVLVVAVAIGVGRHKQGAERRTIAAAPAGARPNPIAKESAASSAAVAATSQPASNNETPPAPTQFPPAGAASGPRPLQAERVQLAAHLMVTARSGTSATAWVDRGGEQHVELVSGAVELSVSGSVHPRLVVDAGDYHFRDRGTIFEVGRAGPAVWLHVKAGAVAVSKDRRALAVVRAQHSWSSRFVNRAPEAPARSTVASRATAASVAPPASLALPPSATNASDGSAAADPAPQAPPAAVTPTTPTGPRPMMADCRALQKQQRDGEAQICLRALADGNDLPAETALYELARLQRKRLDDSAAALVTLQKQRRLFPNGALRDEAELTTIELLPQVGRYRSALDLSDSFLARHPRHERAPELHLLRANILREIFTDYPAAVREYQAIDAADGRVADDAAFFLAVALEGDGRKQDAAEAYRHYLERGMTAHAAVARARLATLAH
ncbi:MAG TPA: hypothetical protein VGL59_11460 [Polyangia bacterium]